MTVFSTTDKALAVGAVGVGVYLALHKKAPPPYYHEGLGEPTMSKDAARLNADTIYAAIYGSGRWWDQTLDEDEPAIIMSLELAQNDADVALIIDAYGERCGAFWTLGSSCLTLPGAISRYLSPSETDAINANYQRKGITFRWAAGTWGT